ncbi:hypothetical protein SAMN02910292_02578 [Lachnospiraceae bacterium XBB2008]|nr:hypothetical protein SAMN02910292_02578 [Lachnospiraceae bacterium XBB2008]
MLEFGGKNECVNYTATFNLAMAVVESIAYAYDFDLNLNTADELASDIVVMAERRIMTEFLDYQEKKILKLDDRIMNQIAKELHVPCYVLRKEVSPRNRKERNAVDFLDYVVITELCDHGKNKNSARIVERVTKQIEKNNKLQQLVYSIRDAIGVV